MRLLASKLVSVLVLGTSCGLLACGEDKPASCSESASCSNGSAGGGGTGGTAVMGDIAANVTKYDYSFDVTTAHGTSRLDLDVAPKGGNCWDVSCELGSVSSVLWNDTSAANATVLNGKLRACGPGVAEGPTLTLGSQVEVPIDLWFGLDVGFSRRKNMAGGTFTYLLSWVGGCDRFGPCDDDPSREATAEYLAYVFEDEARPVGEAAATRKYWDTIWKQSTYWPRPTDEPAPAVQLFYGDVYGPGPMVLYLQLEPLLGRSAVLAGIKTFLATPGGRSVTELKDALAQASGKNLDAYFDAWVFGQGKPEWPTFAVKADQVGSEITVSVTQQNVSGKLFGCAVEVEVRGATQSARVVVDFGLTPSNALATTKTTLGEPVTSVVLDPDNHLIGWNAGAPPIVVKRPVLIF